MIGIVSRIHVALCLFTSLFTYILCNVVLQQETIGCTKDTDCDTINSVCVNSTCQCLSGYVTSSDKTRCLPSAYGYGSPCQDSVQCSSGLQVGGQCVSDACVCAPGFHYLLGQCIKTRGLGELCKDDNQCFVNNDFESTVCREGKCQCSDGCYKREYSDCRRASYAPGEPCGIAEDCQFPNAVCTMARVCDYVNTTQPTPPTPVSQGEPQRVVLDYEDEEKEKTQSFSAIEISCGKKSLHVEKSKNASYKTIGANCTNLEDCESIINSYCSVLSSCECLPGYYSSDAKDSCLPEIASPCSNDSGCRGRYMMCRNSTWCTCRPGFVASPGNRFCLKESRNIGWSCLHDIQCSFFGLGGRCVKKKCTCSNDTHFEKEHLFCWRNVAVGDSCLVPEDCRGGGVGEECTGGFCKCSEGYHAAENGTKCRIDALKPGDSCFEDSDCVFQSSECIDNICECKSGFFNSSGRCAIGIGGICSEDKECIAVNSYCDLKHCRCHTGYVSSTDSSACLKVADGLSGDCVENDQCSSVLGDLALCIDGKCACKHKSHFFPDLSGIKNQGRCYRDSALGESCQRNAECSLGVSSTYPECRNGFCKCPFQYPINITDGSCTGAVISIYSNASLFSGLITIILLTMN